jgi:predicted DNA-binding ribbon-helix-helix protein
MKSTVIKRSIVVAGRKTSVSLEDPFWKALKEIASRRGVTVSDLVAGIDSDRHHSNLSSALRVFVLSLYRDAVTSGPDHSDQRRRGVIMMTKEHELSLRAA